MPRDGQSLGPPGLVNAALACAGDNLLSAQSFHHLAPANY